MRKLPMMLAAATITIVSVSALVGSAQAAPIAPAGIATATQSTSAIQNVGWGYHRWHRWGWRHRYWGWHHHRYWRWRHRWW